VAYETLAYLAGIVDGEGYIGVKKANAKNSVSPLYHERIQVRMVNEEAISLLKDTLGGSYYRERPRVARGRPLYCWQVSDWLAAEALWRLLPWLIVKRANAENVLRLRASKDDPRAARRGGMRQRRLMDPTVLAEREAIYLRAKELNH
jgi:hypothetical protein